MGVMRKISGASVCAISFPPSGSPSAVPRISSMRGFQDSLPYSGPIENTTLIVATEDPLEWTAYGFTVNTELGVKMARSESTCTVERSHDNSNMMQSAAVADSALQTSHASEH